MALVHVLLEAGADPKAPLPNGATALMLAAGRYRAPRSVARIK